jgi:hypothetical protein
MHMTSAIAMVSVKAMNVILSAPMAAVIKWKTTWFVVMAETATRLIQPYASVMEVVVTKPVAIHVSVILEGVTRPIVTIKVVLLVNVQAIVNHLIVDVTLASMAPVLKLMS